MKANIEALVGLGVALVISLALSLLFVSPVLKGQKIRQGDIVQFDGAASEIKQYREQGEEILWTNTMFSGMPSVLISVKYSANLFNGIRLGLTEWLPHPSGTIFLLLISFYVMLMCMKVDPWLSLGGSVAFAFSTYFIFVLAAGHNTKVTAIAFIPALFGGLYHALRHNPFVGAAIFGLSLALEIVANHIQMTYYIGFFLVFYIIAEGIGAIAKGKIKKFALGLGLVGIMALLTGGSNYVNLKSVSDYGKYSTRSQSELTLDKGNQTAGLNRDYITDWSNGVGETFTFLIPNFKGGETGAIGETNKQVLKKVSPQVRPVVAQLNAYWGDQPFVGGAVYVGAFVLLLFVFAIFYVKSPLKWAALVGTIWVIMLSWGRHYPALTNLMIDYFPLYDKFRAVSSILIVAEFTIPLLAVWALARMVEQRNMGEKVRLFNIELPFSWTVLFLSLAGAFMLFTLIFAVAPGMFVDFFATGEVERLTEQLLQSGFDQGAINSVLGGLEDARSAILRADALRSLIFLVLGTVLVWSFAWFKYSKYILAAGFFLLTVVDIVPVSARYLNSKNFAPAKKETKYVATPSDDYINADKDYYRTANLTVSVFQDASTSHTHHSIGGYHGAKLKIYQELIEYVLSEELYNLQTGLRQTRTLAGFDSLMKRMPALNMLNTRYFILGPDGPGAVLKNPSALGNAWFPSKIIPVETADEEIMGIKNIDPAREVVMRKQYADMFTGISAAPDSVSSVKLLSYHPEKLEYEVNAATDKILLFSEVWYPDGWKAFVDGTETPIARADYVLRAIRVPAGKHKVELSYISNFKKDSNISLIFSIVLLLTSALLFFSGKIPFMKRLSADE